MLILHLQWLNHLILGINMFPAQRATLSSWPPSLRHLQTVGSNKQTVFHVTFWTVNQINQRLIIQHCWTPQKCIKMWTCHLDPGRTPFFRGGGTLFLMAAVPHLQALHHPVHPTHHLRPWRSPSKPRHFGILPNSLGLYIDTHHMCA